MAIHITEECINCGACEPECPNTAIYEAGAKWTFADGTKLSGLVDFGGGLAMQASDKHVAVSSEVYYIVPQKCTECTGFHEEPQCAAVCPVDCCVPDPDHVDTVAELEARKAWMHDGAAMPVSVFAPVA